MQSAIRPTGHHEQLLEVAGLLCAFELEKTHHAEMLGLCKVKFNCEFARKQTTIVAMGNVSHACSDPYSPPGLVLR